MRLANVSAGDLELVSLSRLLVLLMASEGGHHRMSARVAMTEKVLEGAMPGLVLVGVVGFTHLMANVEARHHMIVRVPTIERAMVETLEKKMMMMYGEPTPTTVRTR